MTPIYTRADVERYWDALTALHLKYDGDIPDDVRDAVKAGGADRLELMRARGAVKYWTREIERWTEILPRATGVYICHAKGGIEFAMARLEEHKARLAKAEAAMQRKQVAE